MTKLDIILNIANTEGRIYVIEEILPFVGMTEVL
jgi:hypothetical protein